MAAVGGVMKYCTTVMMTVHHERVASSSKQPSQQQTQNAELVRSHLLLVVRAEFIRYERIPRKGSDTFCETSPLLFGLVIPESMQRIAQLPFLRFSKRVSFGNLQKIFCGGV